MSRDDGAGLPARLVRRAFPFHFAVDADARLCAVGPSLARMCPAAVVGAPVEQAVTATSPRGLSLSPPDPLEAGLVLLTVRTHAGELLLRGELVADGDLLWFLGSPWLTDLAALEALGLTLADFAVNDPVIDLLLLLQAQRSAQADVEELVERMQAAATAQTRAAEQERRLAAELHAVPDLALRVASDGTLLAVRPAHDGDMAVAGAELTGRSAYDAFPWLAHGLPDALAQALADGQVQQLTARTARNGDPRHYEVRVVRAEDEEALVLVRDVSEVRAMQEQLHHRAFHDPLTGLANRALFADRVEHALAGAARSSDRPTLLLLDLDDFKQVNDSYGHPAGDAVLATVAQRLLGTVRPQDTVARLGGDEFAVLLDDGGIEEGERLAHRLLSSVRMPVAAGTVVASVGASVGVVCAQPGDDLVSLLRHGDAALYVAKTAGKGRCAVYDDRLRREVQERTTLEADLRDALRDGDQLPLHYQPIRHLGTGAVYGWEALLRWRHPRLGLLLPEAFLPLVDELGLVDRLTAHVLDRAVAAARRLGGLMHVNLSPAQLVAPTLAQDVQRALDRARLPGRQLVLELVETALIGDAQEAVAAMQRVRALDVGMSLDDFGTGFSSLARLHALPFTELKLDRSFLASLRPDGRDAVAEAILSLGGALGLTVVAEGVESQAQAERLRGLGCRYGQGFHLGRPVEAPAAS